MFEIRRATIEDREFLWHLKVASMRPYIEAVYGWDDAVQMGFFEEGFRPGAIEIIRWDRRDVGMFELQARETEWFLARIELLPEFQGRGIGTAVLQRAIAAAAGKPLRLKVFKVNPAQKLYERLGFVRVEETTTHYTMERTPTRTGPPPSGPFEP